MEWIVKGGGGGGGGMGEIYIDIIVKAEIRKNIIQNKKYESDYR